MKFYTYIWLREDGSPYTMWEKGAVYVPGDSKKDTVHQKIALALKLSTGQMKVQR